MSSRVNKITEDDIATFVINPTMHNYERIAGQNADYPAKGTFLGAVYCALALGEAGEAQNQLKKAWRDQWRNAGAYAFDVPARAVITAEHRHKLALELGDNLWYIVKLANELGYSLEEIARLNLHKIASPGR